MQESQKIKPGMANMQVKLATVAKAMGNSGKVIF